MKNTYETFEGYFLLFPAEIQMKLKAIRDIVHLQISNAEECISYQMPAFKYKNKPLIYFAAYKNHIGFYPLPETLKKFEKDFTERKYSFSKGAVQFPLEEQLPLALIEKMVQFRISEIEGI